MACTHWADAFAVASIMTAFVAMFWFTTRDD